MTGQSERGDAARGTVAFILTGSNPDLSDRVLEALTAAPDLSDIRAEASDPSELKVVASVPAGDVLPFAVRTVASLPGFAVAVHGTMPGAVPAVVFSAVPDGFRTARPGGRWRRPGRRAAGVASDGAADRAAAAGGTATVGPVLRPGRAPSISARARRSRPVVRPAAVVAGPPPPAEAPAPTPPTVQAPMPAPARAHTADVRPRARFAPWRLLLDRLRGRFVLPAVAVMSIAGRRAVPLAAALWPAILASAFVYVAGLGPAGSDGFSLARDAMAHVTVASQIADQWREGVLFPRWLPEWHLGTAVFATSAPVPTWFLAALSLAGDPQFALRAFLTICFAVASLSAALCLRRALGTPGAIVAGAAYGLAPAAMRSAFTTGALPLLVLFAALPSLIWLTVRLAERPTSLRFLASALLWAVVATSDFRHAAFFSVALAAGAVAAGFLTGPRGAINAMTGLVATALGWGIAAIWLVPALGPDGPGFGLDPASAPLPSPKFIELLGTRPGGTAPAPYLGTVLLLGVLGLWLRRRDPVAVVGACAAGLALATWFALSQPGRPELELAGYLLRHDGLTLLASAGLAIGAGALAAATASALVGRARLVHGAIFATLAMLAVVWFDSRSEALLARYDRAHPWLAAVRTLDSVAPAGRFLDYGSIPELAYLPVLEGRELASGWFGSTGVHDDRLQRLQAAVGKGHSRFVQRELQQWGVAGVFAPPADSAASDVLQRAGFARVSPGETGRPVAYYAAIEAPGTLHRVTRNAVVAGRAHEVASVLFPWAARAEGGDVAAIDNQLLEGQQLLILAEAGTLPAGVEASIASFRARGGAVLVLLGNDPAVWRGGVAVERRRFDREMRLIDPSGGAETQTVGGFGTDGTAWEALVVSDTRTSPLLVLQDRAGRDLPLMSRVDDGLGPLYVIGGGFVAHGWEHPDEPLGREIERVLHLQLPALNLGPGLEALDSSGRPANGGVLVDAGQSDATVLLGTNVSTSWLTVTVDGVAVDVTDYEGLAAVTVPPGLHAVRIVGGPFTAVLPGLVCSAVAATLLLLAIVYRQRVVAFADAVAPVASSRMRMIATPRPLNYLFGSRFDGFQRREPARGGPTP